MDTRGKFGEHERSVRVAWGDSMNQFFYNIATLRENAPYENKLLSWALMLKSIRSCFIIIAKNSKKRKGPYI